MSVSKVTTPRPPAGAKDASRKHNTAASLASNDDLAVSHTAELSMVATLRVLDSRQRHEAHKRSRVMQLHEKDVKRTELVLRQHSARLAEMSADLSHLHEEDSASYQALVALHEKQQQHSARLRQEEIDRRTRFLQTRERVMSECADTAMMLRATVFEGCENAPEIVHRQSPSSSSTTPPTTVAVAVPRRSPIRMSKEVANRVLPSPRRADDAPLSSKEALQKHQQQRDEQVEQQRLVQEQHLAEKKRRREEQAAALRQRLDAIITSAREENERRLRLKEEENERIRQWRWKRTHQLRSEAVERLEAEEQQGATSPNKSSASPRSSPKANDKNKRTAAVANHAVGDASPYSEPVQSVHRKPSADGSPSAAVETKHASAARSHKPNTVSSADPLPSDAHGAATADAQKETAPAEAGRSNEDDSEGPAGDHSSTPSVPQQHDNSSSTLKQSEEATAARKVGGEDDETPVPMEQLTAGTS